MLVVAAIAQTAAIRLVQPCVAAAFCALIALGTLLRLEQPGGRQAAPIAGAGALAYAMLIHIGGTWLPGTSLRVGAAGTGGTGLLAAAPPLQVVAVIAAGMTLGALPHAAAGRPAGITGMASQLIAIAWVPFVFRPLVDHAGLARPDRWWLAFAVMVGLIAGAWMIRVCLGAMIRVSDLRARFGVALFDEARMQFPIGVAIGASTILIVFAAEVMGLAELAVIIGPLLVTQVAFRRYGGIRATYLQTVRALSRVTEVGGYVESGHSRRVAGLAVAVGRELGMSETDLLDLEYAALMHDIGQLSLQDPIPGGATVLVARQDEQRIAELGADVIREAGVLERVAELVRCQCWPSRGHDPEPPVGSMIIRAVNAFDDLVGGSTDRDRIGAALERLRLDAVEYNPGVVEALSEVALRRRGSQP